MTPTHRMCWALLGLSKVHNQGWGKTQGLPSVSPLITTFGIAFWGLTVLNDRPVFGTCTFQRSDGVVANASALRLRFVCMLWYTSGSDANPMSARD